MRAVQRVVTRMVKRNFTPVDALQNGDAGRAHRVVVGADEPFDATFGIARIFHAFS